MTKPRKDLTHKTFGQLYVEHQANDYISPTGKHKTLWHCRCKCGSFTNVSTSNLLAGKVVSCGCFYRQSIGIRSKKYNDYEIQEDYVIMYTQKGEMFLVDLDDFWRVRNICWHYRKDGYVEGHIPNSGKASAVLLHRFIANVYDIHLVDHIGGNETKYDYRKSNLRLANKSQNGANRGLYSHNTSGYTGVSWSNRDSKWRARIHYNNKDMHLGYFNTIEEAIAARKMAEDKYFGEFSYDNSQKLAKERNQE